MKVPHMDVTDENMAKLSVGELEEEIEKRRKTMDEMVGWLYPRVLQGEIDKIRDHIRRRTT